MNKIKIIHAEGTFMEDAFNNGANFALAVDATKAWNKAGKPDTEEDMKNFAYNVLKDKTSLVEGLGAFIILQKYKVTDPIKPVKAENIVGVGTRKWKTVYQFVDVKTELPIIPPFIIADKKADAVKQAKELAVTLNTDILINVSKTMTAGTASAAVVKIQTPLVVPGKYIFFGVEDVVELAE